MKIYTIEEVLNGGEINILYKRKGNWFAACKEVIFNENDKPIENVFEISHEYLFSRVPKLKGSLEQPDKTYINIDYKTGEININLQHKHIGIPGHFGKAARQSNVKINWPFYIRLHRKLILKRLLILIGIALSGYLLHWMLYLPAIVFFAYNILVSASTRNTYLSGHLGPAIVIDPKKGKIAAYTDLSLGAGDFPIIRVKNMLIPEKYKVKNLKITVAGGYQKTHKYDHWNYYYPQPIISATNDPNVINESLNRIPNSEWLKIEAELKNFDEVPLEGYYPINIENSNWKGIDLNEIFWNDIGKEKGNLTPDERRSIKRKEDLAKEREGMPTLGSIWQKTISGIKDDIETQKKRDELKKKK